jgi:hypothetical protein
MKNKKRSLSVIAGLMVASSGYLLLSSFKSGDSSTQVLRKNGLSAEQKALPKESPVANIEVAPALSNKVERKSHPESEHTNYNDLPIGQCNAEHISYEDEQMRKAWEANHPDKVLQQQHQALIEEYGWKLESMATESPAALYALADLVPQCYGAPRNETELALMSEEARRVAKQQRTTEAKNRRLATIDKFRQQLEFCKGRSTPGGVHIFMIEEAAKKGHPLALLDMANNYLSHGMTADPAESLEYAQLMENSLTELTYDRAVLIGRLYVQADITKPNWLDIEYEGLTNIHRGMAYAELAKRIMPAPNMPASDSCNLIDELLFQLHVHSSTHEQMRVASMSEDLYLQWLPSD